MNNCHSSELGKWEPFRTRKLKQSYIAETLDLSNFSTPEYISHEISKDSVNSYESREYFVGSFTNFKSYDVDERPATKCKSKPEEVKDFVNNYDFLSKKDSLKETDFSKLVKKEINKVLVFRIKQFL